MKIFILRSLVKMAIAVGLCIIISLIVTDYFPIISNEMAVNQLENSNENWIAMNEWYQIQNYVNYAFTIIGFICLFSIGNDFYRMKKRNEEF